MLNSASLFAERRMSLGLSINDVQSHLSSKGFNYSIDLINAIERGERRFPVENPGFMLAMAECLSMPVMSLRQAALNGINSLRAERAFWQKTHRLRPQNQFLLRWVLQHPDVTQIPGFSTWFELVKVIALQLPYEWFAGRR